MGPTMYRTRTTPWKPRSATVPKKWIPVASFLTVAFVVWLFRPLLPVPVVTWEYPSQGQVGVGAGVEAQVAVGASVGIGTVAGGTQEVITQQQGDKIPAVATNSSSSTSEVARPTQGAEVEMITSEAERQKNLRVQIFGPGTPQPVGYSYTKTLVVPKTKDEDTNWIDENFGGSETINSAVYTVDDLDSELHPPKNKGHEVMVYLSYIIDHYNNLSDVNIFMHSHRYAWHNNELLDLDAVQMVSRLSAERVQREGYMNMRCSWDPGCPSWMHPGTVEEDINKQEETMLAKSWSELFPLDPIPYTLAQPCCAQFAISRDRIRSLPLARYVYYRDWLLRTSLSDYISGRIWEYVWQFVFTGQNIVCPLEHVCLCDGFGVCFGGEEEFNHYAQKNQERVKLQEELDQWIKDHEAWMENDDLEPPEIGKDLELKGRIDALQAWCDAKKQKAKEHGDVAMHRAKEAGRPWKDGDGF